MKISQVGKRRLLIVALLAMLIFVGLLVRYVPEAVLWYRWSQHAVLPDRPPGKRSDQLCSGASAVFDNIEFIWCLPGTFRMGSDQMGHQEAPEHDVTLTHGFWLAKYEITKAQWTRVMGTKPWRDRMYISKVHQTFTEINPRYLREQIKYIRREPLMIMKGIYDPDTPATHITLEEIAEFLSRISPTGASKYRLPTEAEWEYACRAGASTAALSAAPSEAWCGNVVDMVQPVGGKTANAWGFHDIQGNSWELLYERPRRYTAEATRDPYVVPDGIWDTMVTMEPPGAQITPEHFVVAARGGGFRSSASDCACAARSAPNWGGKCNDFYGFRLLREAEPHSPGDGK